MLGSFQRYKNNRVLGEKSLSAAVVASFNNAAAEGYFIDVFEFAANWYAAGNARDLQVEIFELAGNVERSRIAFYGRAECQDNFFNFGIRDTLKQGIYGQVARANSFNWGNNAA